MQEKKHRPQKTNIHITERIRAMCRDGVEIAVPKIIAIANGDNPDSNPSAQIRAFNALADQGMIERDTVMIEHTDWLRIVVAVTCNHIEDQQAYEAWLDDLRETLKGA